MQFLDNFFNYEFITISNKEINYRNILKNDTF